MWLDVRATLAEIEGRPHATTATTATNWAEPEPRVAEVAGVATTVRPKSQTAPPSRADGLDLDAGAYLDRLRLRGPATYGAMAAALGWGATQAWQAEAKLRAAGLVKLAEDGRAELITRKGNP